MLFWLSAKSIPGPHFTTLSKLVLSFRMEISVSFLTRLLFQKKKFPKYKWLWKLGTQVFQNWSWCSLYTNSNTCFLTPPICLSSLQDNCAGVHQRTPAIWNRKPGRCDYHSHKCHESNYFIVRKRSYFTPFVSYFTTFKHNYLSLYFATLSIKSKK